MSLLEWDRYHLSMAQTASMKSKDPSTKIGAVITRPDHSLVSTGCNGFPMRIKDDDRLLDRAIKYRIVIHGEMNAQIFARGEPLHGYTLYTYPFAPCDRCAPHVIQWGITRVVAPICPINLRERWEENLRFAQDLFEEAGVEVTLYDIRTIL